jgi:hypothetical protein
MAQKDMLSARERRLRRAVARNSFDTGLNRACSAINAPRRRPSGHRLGPGMRRQRRAGRFAESAAVHSRQW